MPHPLATRFDQRDAMVGVIGLGYVGLPVLLAFGRAGFRVHGFDIDAAKPAALMQGDSYIHHIPAAEVRDLLATGRFVATTDFARTADCDALIICVPTPLTRKQEPDLSFITGTCESIAPHLRSGQLIVLESTTYPGTTDEIVKPILERGGLREGRDFLLAYSPEREDPGNRQFRSVEVPKIIGADNPDARECANALYASAFKKVVAVSSTRAAELTKLFENVFRSVNIALVNELKMLCDRMGMDVWEIIDAAATKPFGFMPFYPGPGLGGHCIPIDPFYLTWKAREFGFSTRLVQLAGEINTGMPDYVVGRTMAALERSGKAIKGARILVLGLAYKRDVDDVRESPAFEIIEKLTEHGATVAYHDPLVPRTHAMRNYDLGMESIPLTPENVRAQDAVIIVTDHSGIDYARVVEHAAIVIDTRNATRGIASGREKIVKA